MLLSSSSSSLAMTAARAATAHCSTRVLAVGGMRLLSKALPAVASRKLHVLSRPGQCFPAVTATTATTATTAATTAAASAGQMTVRHRHHDRYDPDHPHHDHHHNQHHHRRSHKHCDPPRWWFGQHNWLETRQQRNSRVALSLGGGLFGAMLASTVGFGGFGVFVFGVGGYMLVKRWIYRSQQYWRHHSSNPAEGKAGDHDGRVPDYARHYSYLNSLVSRGFAQPGELGLYAGLSRWLGLHSMDPRWLRSEAKDVHFRSFALVQDALRTNPSLQSLVGVQPVDLDRIECLPPHTVSTFMTRHTTHGHSQSSSESRDGVYIEYILRNHGAGLASDVASQNSQAYRDLLVTVTGRWDAGSVPSKYGRDYGTKFGDETILPSASLEQVIVSDPASGQKIKLLHENNHHRPADTAN